VHHARRAGRNPSGRFLKHKIGLKAVTYLDLKKFEEKFEKL
jgi:hypothetical protein